jgi:DNA uptake protein ComE-like DNA-binding protein
MDKKIVRLAMALAVAVLCATWSPAQEDPAPARKKPLPKEALEVKAKARQQRLDAKAKAKAEAQAKAVDINHASLAELKQLPGMTDAYAAAIIAKRPYRSKAELVTKQAIPEGLYQSLRRQVAAK